MKFIVLIRMLLVASLLLCTNSKADGVGRLCADEISSRFLSYILTQDGPSILKIANNPEVFDSQTLMFLIGDEGYRFPVRHELRSAYAILARGPVLSKVVVQEGGGGTKVIDVVYLPQSTAEDFSKLSEMVRAEKAEPFLNYVACKFIWKDEEISMPHACYAETDVLD